MAHNSLAIPAGWVNGTVPTPSQMTTLDQNGYTAVNGDAGGTWSPSSQIILGGAGLSVTGAFVASNGTLTNGKVNAPPNYVTALTRKTAVPCRPWPGVYTGAVAPSGSLSGPATAIGYSFDNAATDVPIPRFPGFITQITNTGTNTFGPSYVVDLSPYVRHGATLISALLTATLATHTTEPPVHPALGIFRFQADGSSRDQTVAMQSANSLPSTNRLLSTFSQQDQIGSGSVSGYNAHYEIVNFVPDQNNVIDTTQYTYLAVIWDEGGTGAIVGNAFEHIILTQTIPQMPF